jgi:hypothetical protein
MFRRLELPPFSDKKLTPLGSIDRASSYLRAIFGDREQLCLTLNYLFVNPLKPKCKCRLHATAIFLSCVKESLTDVRILEDLLPHTL